MYVMKSKLRHDIKKYMKLSAIEYTPVDFHKWAKILDAFV